jgi:hypothetical protein
MCECYYNRKPYYFSSNQLKAAFNWKCLLGRWLPCPCQNEVEIKNKWTEMRSRGEERERETSPPALNTCSARTQYLLCPDSHHRPERQSPAPAALPGRLAAQPSLKHLLHWSSSGGSRWCGWWVLSLALGGGSRSRGRRTNEEDDQTALPRAKGKNRSDSVSGHHFSSRNNIV